MSGLHTRGGGLDARRGFARTLAFGLAAALGVPAVAVALAPVGSSLALCLYLVGLAIAYLGWIAGSRRRALVAGAIASAAVLLLPVLGPSVGFTAVAAALLLAAVRSGYLYRGASPRALVLEVGLLLGGLATAKLLATPGVLGMALAVWGFFVVQSLYFLLARPRARTPGGGGDPFERVRERLEGLLEDLESAH